MYLPQFQEICEKQGWDFKWSDDGESAYITLMTLPNKHLFIVNKNNFAKEVTALSETYLLDEYAKTSGSCAPIFCEDFAVSAALSALAAALNVAAVEAKTWICTDPDTCQWRRQVGETKFELYDIFEAPDNYFAVHGVVDPAEDLTPSELHQLEDSYDGLLDNSTSESERWALLAEAHFETEEFSAEREVFDTFEEAEASIRAKIEADNIKLPKSDPNDENDELWKLSDALYARDVANGVVKTRLDAIRSLDKLRLAVFLNDIHSNVKDFPSDNLSWCDWLNKPDDGHLLDVKTAR